MKKALKRRLPKASSVSCGDLEDLSNADISGPSDLPGTKKKRRRSSDVYVADSMPTLTSENLPPPKRKPHKRKRRSDEMDPCTYPSNKKKVAHSALDSSVDDDIKSENGISGSSNSKNPTNDRSIQRANRAANQKVLRRTIFVGNLPLGITRKELKRLFNRVLKQDAKSSAASCQVESVRFRGVVAPTGGSGKLAKKRAAILCEGSAISQSPIAYVVLTSAVGVPAALTLNGHLLQAEKAMVTDHSEDGGTSDNRPISKPTHIRVDRASGGGQFSPAQCVFLGNLPFDVQDDEVRDAMSTFGQISNVRLIRDTQTGAVKGFGFVQFSDPSVVSLAIRGSGTVSIRNRSIRIQQWQCCPNKQNDDRKHSVPKFDKHPRKPHVCTGEKRNRKLHLTGKVKGITLPSNLRGPQRQTFLQKRLIKKQKRSLRRQQNAEVTQTAKHTVFSK